MLCRGRGRGHAVQGEGKGPCPVGGGEGTCHVVGEYAVLPIAESDGVWVASSHLSAGVLQQFVMEFGRVSERRKMRVNVFIKVSENTTIIFRQKMKRKWTFLYTRWRYPVPVPEPSLSIENGESLNGHTPHTPSRNQYMMLVVVVEVLQARGGSNTIVFVFEVYSI